MKREYSAGIVIYYKQDAVILYLLLNYAHGHWDFPKGHIEGDETKEEAALRELKEETGLEVRIKPGLQEEFTYYFRGPDSKELIHKTVFFFMGESLTQKVTLSIEHIGYAWLPYEQAIGQLTYKNARDLLHKVHQNLN